MRPWVVPTLLFLAAARASPAADSDPEIPHLRRQGTATQLIVEGKPFLMRGGESDQGGVPQEILSPFAKASRDADARAFAALQRHLREVDGTRNTVVMVQVENEIGMIPSARDHSPEADRAFSSGRFSIQRVRLYDY